MKISYSRFLDSVPTGVALTSVASNGSAANKFLVSRTSLAADLVFAAFSNCCGECCAVSENDPDEPSYLFTIVLCLCHQQNGRTQAKAIQTEMTPASRRTTDWPHRTLAGVVSVLCNCHHCGEQTASGRKKK
jgi:hypothetical protein